MMTNSTKRSTTEMDEILNPEGLADQFESPENEQKDKIIIKAIGVGGGGGNAVNYMFRQGIQHVSFVVLNTDRQALRQSPVPTKVMIGDGLGAGDGRKWPARLLKTT